MFVDIRPALALVIPPRTEAVLITTKALPFAAAIVPLLVIPPIKVP
jgi:hypothetical protein